MLARSLALAATLLAPCLAAGRLPVDSLDGPVSKNDIATFKAFIKGLTPSDASANEWAQGHSGENTKALGLVYEISKDVEVLNRMLTFCDKVVSIRNDKSPKGCTIWTGAKDPVWVDCTKKLDGKVYTGGEQGDPVGHLGNCARLILSTPAIWDKAVPDNDPHNYGRTYLLRAKTYVKEADEAIDGHIIKSLLDTSRQGKQYFSAGNPYKGGTPVPWNQQMMFNYGFYNMAIAHEILRDDPQRAAKYHQIVQDSIDWFFAITKPQKDKKGNPAYLWYYAPLERNVEDSNHSALDMAGFSRLYASGKYNLTAEQLKPFAYTVIDNIILGKGKYAGRVDGTSGNGNSAGTNVLRSGHLLMAEFLPSAYHSFLIDITASDVNRIDVFSRLLWLKDRMNKGNSPAHDAQPAPDSAPADDQ